MAHRILKHAGIAPTWIESDKVVRALLDQIERLMIAHPSLPSRP